MQSATSPGAASEFVPWAISEDVILENNKINHVYGGITSSIDNDSSFAPFYGLKPSNIKFKNSLIDDISSTRWGVPGNTALDGRFLQPNNVEDLQVDHITLIDKDQTTGEAMVFATNNNFRLKITNSIFGLNDYGIIGSGSSTGINALNPGTGGGINGCSRDINATWNLAGNIMPIYGASSSCYPSITPYYNQYPANYSAVGFTDLTNGNYTLTTSSIGHNQATDGTDIGANIPLLNQRTACTVSGIGTNCSSTQTPYPGPNAPNAPITLEAENFDNGGQGVAYNENNGNTGSSVYRSTPVEAVDIQARSTASNGYVVFEASAGEWLEYTINVPVTRKYDIGVRYASEFNNGKFHIEIDGVNVTQDMTVVSTGTWGTFKNLTKRGVMISAGTQHVVRLALDTNSPDGCGCIVGNFDAIRFTSTVFDFDDDGRADISLFRPSANNWYLDRSSAGFTAVSLGASTDIIAPGDFDGDGKTDVSVFRPSNGTWYRYNSSNSVFVATQFGANGDIPVQADYDGDGKSDTAVWRPSNGTWYYLKSSDGGFVGAAFGQNNDKPAVGDFDGDGKSDLAVFRPANGYWYILNSSNASVTAVLFGAGSDNITPADYDGDGKTDVAVFRPSNGTWYLQRSLLGFTGVAFGQSGDIPVPADYDGDGKADVGIFRPSTGEPPRGEWNLLRSTEGFLSQPFGQSGDVPIPSTYVR